MALIECHECGKPKSDEANRCPHCGVKKRNVLWKQNLLAIVLVATFLIVAFAFGWLP